MANDIKSAELCLNAVQALEEQLRGARKTLINSEKRKPSAARLSRNARKSLTEQMRRPRTR